MEEQDHKKQDELEEQEISYFPRIFRDWFSESRMSKWVLGFSIEAVLIVFSVLLALAVNEWRADRARTQKAKTALKAIQSELKENQNEFRKTMYYHRDFIDTLEYYKKEDLQPPMVLLNKGIFQPASVYDTAWETAKQSGITEYMDYELVLDLSSLYQREAYYRELSGAIGRNFYVSSTFEKGTKELLQDRYKNWISLLDDFSRREENLAESHKAILEKIDKALDN